MVDICAFERATTRVAPTNKNAAREGLRPRVAYVARRIRVDGFAFPRFPSRTPGGGVGDFSTLFRSAPKLWASACVHRAQSPVYATDEIRGKTGPAPSGLPPSRARGRRRSFWSFFLGVQEKGRRIKKSRVGRRSVDMFERSCERGCRITVTGLIVEYVFN